MIYKVGVALCIVLTVYGQIAAQHEAEPPQQQQIGAEGEIYDPPFFRRGFTRADGSGGFGPMASSDFGNDLDIPTVIRNLSD